MELVMAMINRRSFIVGLIFSIVILCSAGVAKAAENLEEKSAPDDLGNGDGASDGKVAMEIVLPLDEGGNSPMIVLPKKAEYIIDVKPLAEPNDAPPISIIFRNWRGFAFKDNESYSVSVSIESLRSVAALNVRKLLASNMTLEEISAEIEKTEGKAIDRGILKIGDGIYRMDDIRMIPAGNNTLLDANISELDYGSAGVNITMTIGHLNATIKEEGGPEVSQGCLNISNNKYSGSYRVLLDSQLMGRDMKGHMPGHMMH
jgi:hypothetical protein